MEYTAKDYLSNQQNSLNNEIASLLNEIRIIERQCTIVSIGIWAWILSQTKLDLNHLLVWLPVVISFFGFFRCFSLHMAVRRAAKYLLRVEDKLSASLNGFIGWEHFIRDKKYGKDSWLKLSVILYMILLIVFNSLLIVLVKLNG